LRLRARRSAALLGLADATLSGPDPSGKVAGMAALPLVSSCRVIPAPCRRPIPKTKAFVGVAFIFA
jgi:hypothetical protein